MLLYSIEKEGRGIFVVVFFLLLRPLLRLQFQHGSITITYITLIFISIDVSLIWPTYIHLHISTKRTENCSQLLVDNIILMIITLEK